MQVGKRLSSLDITEFIRRPHTFTPAQLISITFALAIFVGTVLLALPISHSPGYRVGLLDAFFTATSAVCVTGLAVVDTGSAYSLFGKIVIMLLIQAGGLGIISFGTLIALASGRRISFRERMQLQAQINAQEVGGIINLIRNIVLLVVSVELVGAVLLYFRFAQVEGRYGGAFYALFHSISAFNNAGFAFYSDSLSPYVFDPLVNTVIILLIVLGGLGYIVIFDLITRYVLGKRKPLSLHTKIVLVSTAGLIVFGTIVIVIFEWSNAATLGMHTIPQKLQAALFQAVTPRTAGFNTVNYAGMRSATLIFTILLMFIGGSPGSTAGGIKTVTFFVLMGSVWSLGRGHGELNVFNRRVPFDLVVKAGVIALIGVMLSGASVTLLALSEGHLDTFALLFETVSAVSTVGLSLGITPELSVLGKLIIIMQMYVGRLGPLTFALALIQRAPERGIAYPTENIVIG